MRYKIAVAQLSTHAQMINLKCLQTGWREREREKRETGGENTSKTDKEKVEMLSNIEISATFKDTQSDH